MFLQVGTTVVYRTANNDESLSSVQLIANVPIHGQSAYTCGHASRWAASVAEQLLATASRLQPLDVSVGIQQPEPIRSDESRLSVAGWYAN